MGGNKKKRVDVVYSTNKDYSFDYDEDGEQDTVSESEQELYVSIDRKQRKGKSVTLIEGFIGSEEELKALGKLLKSKCGVGGSAKDGEIIVQGEVKDKVYQLLLKEGYQKTKKRGG